MLDRTFFNKLAFKTAIKAGIALTIAASIAYYYHWSLFWWAIFVAFLSIAPDIGSSIMMMIARFTGTFVGAFFAVIIALFYQYPWVYYFLIFIFIFVCLYYIVKPAVSWAGILCLVTGVVVTLVGPKYSVGIFHYAVERCLQISFAIVVVTFTLLILKGQYAHRILREKIKVVLGKYQSLWELVIQNYISGKSSDNIQESVREISVELNAMLTLLGFARYEVWKKNFNAGQCLALINLLKRLLAIFAAINEASRYVKSSDFNEEVQQYLHRLGGVVTNSLANIMMLTEEVSTSYDQKIDELESGFVKLMDETLADFVKKKGENTKKELNRIAWFSLVQRILLVTSLMRRVTVLMNSDKVNVKLKEQLDEELRSVKGEEHRDTMFNSIRVRLALHGAVAAAIMITLQEYFRWSPLLGMVATITSMFIAVSMVLPIAGNIGLGIVGAALGALYTYFSLVFLNYYPGYATVLMCLFVGAVIASYFIVITKLQGRSFLIFSIYFALVLVYVMTEMPAERTNLDISIVLMLGIFMTAVISSVVSRVIFPIKYKKIMQKRLELCLIGQGLLLRRLEKTAVNSKHLSIMKNDIYQQSQLINRARTSIQYCIDQELYNGAQIDQIRELTYSCELMLLANLSMMHPLSVLPDQKLIEALRVKLHAEYRIMIKNLFNYSRNITNNNWQQNVIIDVDKLKQCIDQAFESVFPQILEGSDRLYQLRAISIMYNSFYRMADIQSRLLKYRGFTL